jgi:hypothetical protein
VCERDLGGGVKERKREGERYTEKETQTEGDRKRGKLREKHTYIHTQRKKKRKNIHTYTEKEKEKIHTYIQRVRKRHT